MYQHEWARENQGSNCTELDVNISELADLSRAQLNRITQMNDDIERNSLEVFGMAKDILNDVQLRTKYLYTHPDDCILDDNNFELANETACSACNIPYGQTRNSSTTNRTKTRTYKKRVFREANGRECINPIVEEKTEVVNCPDEVCPREPQTCIQSEGIWQPSGQCSATCGGGTQTFTRNNRITRHPYNAPECQLPETESKTEPCNTQECPVDCQIEWSEFEPVGECSRECGSGIQDYRKTATIVRQPNATGRQCPENLTIIERRDCNTQPCSVDCAVSDWSDWNDDSLCSQECDGFKNQSRTREIIEEPVAGGKECPTNLKETRVVECSSGSCKNNNNMLLIGGGIGLFVLIIIIILASSD
jgi:hypothetical protein